MNNISDYPFLKTHLKILRLPMFVEHYEQLTQTESDPRSYLAQLASLEVAKRHENRIKRLIGHARFPVMKTLESFAWEHQPELPKATLLQLFDCQFVAHSRSIIFLGRSGLGKTHLMSALGLAACMRGYKVAFYTATALLLQLLAAKRNQTLYKLLRALDRIDFLIVDELGLHTIDREEADLLITVLASRYERRSIGITSNLVFANWGKIFVDELATEAIVDRLVHHGSIFHFTGPSYRLGDRGQPGNGRPDLITTAP